MGSTLISFILTLSTGQTVLHIRSICAVSCSVYCIGEQLIELLSQLQIAKSAIRQMAAATESENCNSVLQWIYVTEKQK